MSATEVERSPVAVSRGYAAAAGGLAAAVALGVSELVAGFTTGQSLVVAVGDFVVTSTPGGAVRLAIETLGTLSKPVLLATVAGGAILLGMLLGPLAARYRHAGYSALALFGAAGGLAAAQDPLTPGGLAFTNAAASVLAGAGVLGWLFDAIPVTSGAGDGLRMPGRGIGSRRQFLAFASGAAAAATLSAFPGRRVGEALVGVDLRRQTITLPALPDGEGAAMGAAKGFEVDGLTPLITPTGQFYRIDTALVVPRINPESWRLGFTGMVDHPYELTFEELLDLATLEESVTLVCVSNEVGGDLAGNAIWRGVPLADLLRRAGVQPGATQVVGRSVDGFTAGFPTEVALDGRAAMVAIAMNGEPLPARHGFPARLVVPGLYGYVSATKWLTEVELTTMEAYDAYWIPRGWAKEAPIKTQSRIDVPRDGQRLRPGRGAIAGVAWGGIRGVSRVEVLVTPAAGGDGPWREARLSDVLSDSTWRQWVLDWDASPGEYVLEVRATDGTGAAQTSEVGPPAPDGASGYHRARVHVRDF